MDIVSKNLGDSLTATEFNQIPSELENTISSTGQTPSDGDLFQVAKAIADYAANGDFYTDSGAADAYVLSIIGSKQAPTSYSDGTRVRFVVGNTNTGASTINVATLGVKNIFLGGAALSAGDLTVGSVVELIYDNANGRFNLFLTSTMITRDSLPVGMINAFPFSTPPGGWLECDGSEISRTTYSVLFTAIDVDYGNGDGSTTFNLPDYRGEFLRGWDHGAGVDPDAASRTDRGDSTTGDNVGTKQVDNFKSHTHTIATRTGDTAGEVADGSGTASSTPATNATGGNETRPTNVNVMWCIKT